MLTLAADKLKMYLDDSLLNPEKNLFIDDIKELINNFEEVLSKFN